MTNPTTALQRNAFADAVRSHGAMIASVALAGALLWLSFRGTEVVALRQAAARMDPVILGLAVLLLGLSYALRAGRWYVLLRGARRDVSGRVVYAATSVGYLANNVMPARAGDVIRSLLIHRAQGVSRSFAFATTLAERLVDVLMLAALTLVLVSQSGVGPDWLRQAAMWMLVLGGSASLAVLVGLQFRDRVHSAVVRIPLGRFSSVTTRILRHAADGLSMLTVPRRFTAFMALSTAVWAIDGVAAVTVAAAMGLQLALPEALLLLCALGLASAAPSTPGYVGIFQFVAVGILPSFGFMRDEAIVYILALQLVIFIQVTVTGLAGGATLGVREVRAAAYAAGER